MGDPAGGWRDRAPWMVAAASLAVAATLAALTLVRLGAPKSPEPKSAMVMPVGEQVSANQPVRMGPSGGSGAPAVAPGGAAPSPDSHVTPVPEQPAPPGPEAGVPEPGTRYVSGSVTDATGAPVPGAKVRMKLDDGGAFARLQVSTDARGRFLLRNLAAGRVAGLEVEAAGFAKSDPLPAFDPPLDGVEITLRRSAAASLRVFTATAAGDVRAPFDGPATVFLLRTDAAESTAPRFAAVSADKVTVRDGLHPLRGLEPGLWRAAVQAGTEYAASEPFAAGVAGAPAPQPMVVLGQRQRLAGTVVSAADQSPIEGALVRLDPSDRPPTADMGRSHAVRADAAGRFVIDGISTGDYRLTLGAEGFSTKTLDSIAVAAGPVPAPATFGLAKGQPSLTVSVVDGGGRPVARAPMVLTGTGPGSGGRVFFERTGADGRHRFDTIPAGAYRVSVTSPGNKARQKTADVTLAGGVAESVELRFRPTVKVAGVATRKGVGFDGLLAFRDRAEVGPDQFARTGKAGVFAVDLEPAEYMVGEARRDGRRVLMRVPDTESLRIELDVP